MATNVPPLTSPSPSVTGPLPRPAQTTNSKTSSFKTADPFKSLTGPNRDAAVALTALFKQYGLESLAPRIIDFIKQGYSSDTITVMLAETPEYKKRFAANDARIKAGLPALSPAEYLSVESAYRQVMSAAGVPKGFYDQPSDFEKWIADDVSPTEIKGRVDAATEFINSADAGALAQMRKFYSKGDLIAYALDRKRAQGLVGKQFEAAKIAGAAADQGIGVDRALSERLAGNGVSQDQARQGFGLIANEQGNANKLAAISGSEGFTVADLANEVFLSDANIAERRTKLASQERARFGSSSGIGTGTLATSKGGSL
jgi:hypothetical protein